MWNKLIQADMVTTELMVIIFVKIVYLKEQVIWE